MQKKLSNKELVAAGHKFAANINADTPLIDMAKMVSELATQLDAALAAAAEAGKQRGAVMTNWADMEDKLRIKQNHIKLRDTYIEELEQRAEAAEAKLAELQKFTSEEKPFMYGIMTANGDAHFEDFCVSSDPGLLEDEIWEWNNSLADNEPKSRVVALYTRPSPAIDLNAVRAEGVEMWIASRNGAWNGTTKQAEQFAAQLRAGNAGKDGSHE